MTFHPSYTGGLSCPRKSMPSACATSRMNQFTYLSANGDGIFQSSDRAGREACLKVEHPLVSPDRFDAINFRHENGPIIRACDGLGLRGGRKRGTSAFIWSSQ